MGASGVPRNAPDVLMVSAHQRIPLHVLRMCDFQKITTEYAQSCEQKVTQSSEITKTQLGCIGMWLL